MTSPLAAPPPDRPAIVMAEAGTTVTYGELDDRSRRFARVLRSAGLGVGDHLAVLLENHQRYLEVVWAGRRAGCHLTPINWHLKAEEAAYVLVDSGSRAVVTSATLAGVLADVAIAQRFVVGGAVAGATPYDLAVEQAPATENVDEVEGNEMFYSSGTMGRPKGIKQRLANRPFGAGADPFAAFLAEAYGIDGSSVYLCPAPLYHAAPLSWSLAVHRLGGTVVVMERFDPELALACIERHRVTHAQFVPTHFVRMLKLDPSVRRSYDVSSLEVVVHAAAPCPVEVKRQMLAWWGPIVHEYYSGTEGVGLTALDSAEWEAHPGSVGRARLGVVHIVGDDGAELPAGETGQVWFESDETFEYHDDPERTAAAYDQRGWASLGDMGHLDADGYLYLTDRVSHMIVSGGVNIYPQEVENELVLHPAVADVAVIGVPDADYGEAVRAVVVAAAGVTPGPALEGELIEHCRARIAHFKCPTAVDFVEELPRLPNGKLLKRELRLGYWPA